MGNSRIPKVTCRGERRAIREESSLKPPCSPLLRGLGLTSMTRWKDVGCGNQMPHAEHQLTLSGYQIFTHSACPSLIPCLSLCSYKSRLMEKTSNFTQEMIRDCSKQGGISVLEDSQELDSQQKQCYKS